MTLCFMHLGHGILVVDLGQIDPNINDYKKIAHINPHRKIKWYVDEKNISKHDKYTIRNFAKTHDGTVSVTQDEKVFLTPPEL